MKKHLLLLFMVLILKPAFGQDDEVFLSKMKINFAVPDLPAQKLVGSQDSKLLRPSTVEALSVILPQFVQSGNFSLPQSFSAEIAPFILLNQNKAISLNKYIKNRLINSLRVSVATGQDSVDKRLGNYKLGLGLRISLIDKGDLKTDKTFLMSRAKNLQTQLQNENEVRNMFIKEKGITVPEFINKRDTDTTFKKEFDDYLAEKSIGPLGKMIGDFDTKLIKDLVEDYKKDNWNATKVDFALALTAISSDSLARNLKKDNFSAWLTGAHPISKWGQILWSANFSNVSLVDSELKRVKSNELTLSTRLFAGNNEAKGFLEAQYSMNSFRSETEVFAYLGSEIYLISGIWLNLYAGVKKSSLINKAELVSNFDFRFTLPGK